MHPVLIVIEAEFVLSFTLLEEASLVGDQYRIGIGQCIEPTAADDVAQRIGVSATAARMACCRCLFRAAPAWHDSMDIAKPSAPPRRVA
ncbi:hypothetical protein AC244_33385 [Ensifer adhaerens]|uniref:Uncharacterized protein n=1 Tax=Ensifer adhaerens TaxID=106592 RepID=A0A0L8BDE3_ENSAD|nr:hypothetical protein AC244_33385 [Ensifer adhaerens]